MVAEEYRLQAAGQERALWKKWGPYLSERQWGTVREDYSGLGDAWNYFSHDQARSRAYRWGEDGLAGMCDDGQRLCFCLALWNGQDAILKERLFGLSNSEGNHGEDVKEYYFYLDSTPTHSYMKYLYKYPQAAYPYSDLVNANRQRSRSEMEYELLDTGVFNEDRYFDVFVEYAKESPEDILVRITAHNRGPQAASIHLLPTLWFRNTWSGPQRTPKPMLRQVRAGEDAGLAAVAASHPELGDMYLYCEGGVPLLFTENESNLQRIEGTPNPSPYVKDGIHEYVVHGNREAVNPDHVGTKVSSHHLLTVLPGRSATVRLRLTRVTPNALGAAYRQSGGTPFGDGFDRVLQARRREADEFYQSITPPGVSEDAARVMRQALAGMLWSKQYYYYDLHRWLEEHGVSPLYQPGRQVRNAEWFHMHNSDVISMPDKWEYPWYAAWDLAFHTVALSLVDLDFAKEQLELTLGPLYLHPSGQVPAYEWNFADANPPVHAVATILVYEAERALRGHGDLAFLRRCFSKLTLNFGWWVNRKDRSGRNVFEGGFLGLDNIGVFDRSSPLPTGGFLEQADGTAWMAMFCQNMLEIAIELAAHDSSYQDMVVKFAEHFVWIAMGLNHVGGAGLWDEHDGFYYDALRLPDGTSVPLKVRSLVGLLPLCATTILEKSQREKVPEAMQQCYERLRSLPQVLNYIHPTGPTHLGVNDRGIFALVQPERLRRILAIMLDDEEFLSPYGIRSISRRHATHPYVFHVGGVEYRVDYQPAESNSGMFGGNSNWRGPIWFPINLLIIRALRQFYLYYGDSFQVECPTGSGRQMNLMDVANELARRLMSIFLRNEDARRAVYGGTDKFQTDPHWRDLILFYEYFHGDNGAGLGASHQTGWTGLVAKLIQMLGYERQEEYLAEGRRAAAAYRQFAQSGRPWNPRGPGRG